MAKDIIKILAISGSLRASSSNSFIIRAIAEFTPANVEYTIYKGLNDLPHFNPGLEGDDTPVAVQDFRRLVKEADGVLICTPEYAFGVPGTLKNALDWTVSTVVFTDKPVALITASSSGEKAHASLLLTLGALGTKITDEATLLISYIRTKVNEKAEISDPVTLEAIKSVFSALIKCIK